MEVLFIGDIHIKFNNINEVNEIINVAKDIKVDFIVLAGDILDSHERVQTQLMNKAYELINTLAENAPLYILVGNHDYIDNSQFCSNNHWLYGLKIFGPQNNIKVVDKPLIHNNVLLTPYIPNGRFKEALTLFTPSWKDVLCIFAHQEIKGCKMGAIISEDGDEWEVDLPTIISGHIHERHRPQENVIYPGSSINHSFGSDSQGIFIFTLKNGEISEKLINLDFAKKKTVYISVDDIVKKIPVIDPNIRYSIEGTIPEIASFKQSCLYNDLRKTCKVVFREKKIVIPKVKKTVLKSFETILTELIQADGSPDLKKDYTYISS